MFASSHLARFSPRAAIVLLPLLLTGCLTGGGGEDRGSISFTDDRGYANQPYPKNYKGEVLAFMKTYLNNPVGVREALMAEPVQRTVNGFGDPVFDPKEPKTVQRTASRGASAARPCLGAGAGNHGSPRPAPGWRRRRSPSSGPG